MKEETDLKGNKVLFFVNKPLMYTGVNGVKLIQKELTRHESQFLSRRLGIVPSRFDEVGKRSDLIKFKR